MPKARSLVQPEDHLGNSWPRLVPPVIDAPTSGTSGLSILLGLPLALAGLTGQGDVIVGTRWEVRTAPNGGGSLVWSVDVSNLLQLLTAMVPPLTLGLGQTYYIRARQSGTILGNGPWSADVIVST